MTRGVSKAQFLERAPALTALVPARFDGFPLAAIDPSAVLATPREARQGQHFFLERMVGCDRDLARAIDFRHLP
jgi:hypothetical protein